MDEALDLGTYLPQPLANASEQAYLDFLWSAFRTNYEAERYEFASLRARDFARWVAACPRWRAASRHPQPLRPFHHARGCHIQRRRHTPNALALLKARRGPLTQIH